MGKVQAEFEISKELILESINGLLDAWTSRSPQSFMDLTVGLKRLSIDSFEIERGGLVTVRVGGNLNQLAYKEIKAIKTDLSVNVELQLQLDVNDKNEVLCESKVIDVYVHGSEGDGWRNRLEVKLVESGLNLASAQIEGFIDKQVKKLLDPKLRLGQLLSIVEESRKSFNHYGRLLLNLKSVCIHGLHTSDSNVKGGVEMSLFPELQVYPTRLSESALSDIRLELLSEDLEHETSFLPLQMHSALGYAEDVILGNLKVLEIPAIGELIIDTLKLQQVQNDLQINVSSKGGFSGKLEALSHITLDKANQQLRLEVIDLTVEKAPSLLKFVTKVFEGKIKDYVQDKLQFNLKQVEDLVETNLLKILTNIQNEYGPEIKVPLQNMSVEEVTLLNGDLKVAADIQLAPIQIKLEKLKQLT